MLVLLSCLIVQKWQRYINKRQFKTLILLFVHLLLLDKSDNQIVKVELNVSVIYLSKYDKPYISKQLTINIFTSEFNN